MGDLIDRKLARRFALMDVDGHGYIEKADYERLVDRFLSAFDVARDSPMGKTLRHNYVKLWRALAMSMDTDRDQRITPEEFTAGIVSGVVKRDGGFDKAIRPATQSVLDIADIDGDGVVSLDEARRILLTLGVEDTETDDVLRKLDTDGDGILSLEEILQADEDFYTSENPEAAGNWLFGPF